MQGVAIVVYKIPSSLPALISCTMGGQKIPSKKMLWIRYQIYVCQRIKKEQRNTMQLFLELFVMIMIKILGP